MTAWERFLASIRARLDQLERARCPDIYFRGHADSAWRLEPGLAREKRINPRFRPHSEDRMYWSFRMRGAHLLPPNPTGWTVLFYMQHFGLPTRLLDWTNSFANALYFALGSGNPVAPCIWILDPYHLNSVGHNLDAVMNINVSHAQDYVAFLEQETKPAGAVATEGDSSVERIRSQGGAFTLHFDLDTPLEKLCPSALTCHRLPKSAIPDARKFLWMAGINDFSVFPDLVGLAKHTRKHELGGA